MASCQKPHVENKHIEYRYILPSGKDLYQLGMTSQEQLNLVLSHLNSRTLESIGPIRKTPFQYAAFFYPELVERMEAFGIKEIEDSDCVMLKPWLLNREIREQNIAKVNEIKKLRITRRKK